MTATVLAIGLLFISLSIFGIGRTYIEDEYKLRMKNSANEVSRAASTFYKSDSIESWNLGVLISTVSISTGNKIFITDSNGIIISCCESVDTCNHIGMQLSPNVIDSFNENGEYIGDYTLDGFYNAEMLVEANDICDSDGNLLGYVFVCNKVDNVFSTWRAFVWVLLATIGGIFGGLLIFVSWYSKHMVSPLDKISQVSRMYARGDFSQRVIQTEDPSNEMGALIESFNNMADSLESAEKRRSEFISNISHELRTPMTTISGFADGILDGTIPKEDEEKYLKSISEETKRLARLVRYMLDISKTKSLVADKRRRTSFDLSELTVQTLLSFEDKAIKKGIDVDPQLPELPILVSADKDGITQVIYNLLDNAIKFADADSCITLKIYTDDGKAYFSVKDIGQQIPKSDLPYIFDRFHKSDKSRSIDKDGVGLGLYLVKTIINGHDEDIAVRSENRETEFVFTLPLAKGNNK